MSGENKSETINELQSGSIQQQKEEAEKSSPLGSQQREEPKDQALITPHKSVQPEQEHKLEEEQQQSVSQQQNSETAEPQSQQQTVAEHDDAVQEYLVKKIQWFDFETKQKKDVLIITQNGMQHPYIYIYIMRLGCYHCCDNSLTYWMNDV